MVYILLFNFTATTEFYTLSLHDALPISIALLGASEVTDLFNVQNLRPSRRVVLLGTLMIVLASSWTRSEEHTSELQSQSNLVCRLLLEKKNYYLFPILFNQ